MTTVAQYVAQVLAQNVCHVFGVCGGGAMYLNDAIAHQDGLRWVGTHHEQAAAFAAEAYARVTNRIGAVHVTAGPGVTNAITGVACAWADSLPMIVIAGQVDSSTMIGVSGLRQMGISEVDGVALMAPITKYAACVTEPQSIVGHLYRALREARSGRMGPVYLEIPLDVQRAEIDAPAVTPIAQEYALTSSVALVSDVANLVSKAKRPVLLLGNGVRLSGATSGFVQRFIDALGIPVMTSWNAADLVHSDHPLNIGRPGIIGNRAANFAIQAADLVLTIGTRLSIPQIGHHPDLFAPNASLIVVDVDEDEMRKKTLNPHINVRSDAVAFMQLMMGSVFAGAPEAWILRCQNWKTQHPPILPETASVTDGVHSYHFLKCLSEVIDENAIIVTDVGTSFVGTMQAMPMTGHQRMFHSPGIAPMGYGLPAAIGAAFAAPDREIICLTGDGGTMFNLQELATIAHHNLPIKIFLYRNGGYKTMQVTQENHFGREALASKSSDMWWPDFADLAEAFHIPATRWSNNQEMEYYIRQSRNINGPWLCELQLSASQTIAPLVKSKVENGKFVPVSIENMWPSI